MRSCSAGTWRLYRNERTRLTPGRFFRVDVDAPHLPFPHPFFSPAWTRGDPTTFWDIGPVEGASFTWVPPDLGIALPPGIPLGTALDFENPQLVAQAVAESQRAGIPIVCWTRHQATWVPYQDFLAIEQIPLQLIYTRIVEQIYDPLNRPRVELAIRRWLGDGVSFVHINQDGPTPNIMIAYTNDIILVFITGTDNAEQAATQAFEGGLPPYHYGNMSSLPIWNQTSNVIFEAMRREGIGGNTPIAITGHSYGGAVGANMVARITTSNPERALSFLSFGMPKPGGPDMQRILEKTRSVHLVNRGDPVTQIPLNVPYGLMFGGIVADLILEAWGKWRNPRNPTLLEEDGRRIVGEQTTLTYDVLLPLVRRAIAHQPLNVGVPHSSTEYYRRMLITQRNPAWPVPPEVWQVLVDFPLELQGVNIQRGEAIAPG